MDTRINRITIEPDVCHGKPVVRGMRWPVEVILDMLSSGMTPNQIVDEHPELDFNDIQACLKYARLSVSGEVLPFAN